MWRRFTRMLAKLIGEKNVMILYEFQNMYANHEYQSDFKNAPNWSIFLLSLQLEKLTSQRGCYSLWLKNYRCYRQNTVWVSSSS